MASLKVAQDLDAWADPKVVPPEGSAIHTIGVLESRTGGSTFGIFPGGLGCGTKLTTALNHRC